MTSLRALTAPLVLALASLACPPAPPAPPAAHDAGPRAVDAGAPVAVPTVPTVPTVPAVDAGARDVRETQEVHVTGPAALTWKGVAGNKTGDGALVVRAGATTVTALNPRHGSSHEVPIHDGVADFDKLPRGELLVRARPSATIFLKDDALGSTPPALVRKLVVGDYTVKAVGPGGKTKTARATVTAGARVEVALRFD